MDFFDKISETITVKGKDIAKKAKDLVDVNTVKANIAEQKKLIRKTYASIGEQYYKDNVDQGQHAYEIEFEIIGEANAKLKELYEQLNTLRNLCVCPECGATIAQDSVYCNKCGTKLPEQPKKEEEYQDVETVDDVDVVVEAEAQDGAEETAEPADTEEMADADETETSEE